MKTNWWKNAVIYQIYPRSFCDSNGDGIGDLRGIISKLDYLADLGVDCLWLSPVYPSPNCDNGYDISDYKNIHPDFGTLQDMDELIAKAKERGIRIIMDLVVNHTSDEHEWFKKALAGDEKYKDYYIFKEGKAGKKGAAAYPNNWGNFFGGDCWTKVDDNLYYLHLFDKKQPDLNWHNPAVYDEVVDILKFWLDRGIAGFRCDVINIIYKNTLADGKKKIALTGLEHYLSTEGNHDILRRLNKDVLDYYDCFTVGETVMVDGKMAKELCDASRGELNEVFFFEHMDVDDVIIKWFKVKYRPRKMIEVLDKWQNTLEWTANYLENHDQPRSVSRFGDVVNYHYESATMLAGMNLCLKGTPFIFEGQEIGMTNCPFDGLKDIQDVESHTIDKTMQKLHFPAGLRRKMLLQSTRDHARTPMQWNAKDDRAGFSSTFDGQAKAPWLMVNPNYKSVNVEDQINRDDSILSFYKKLIAYRKSSDALQWGSYKKLDAPEGVYLFERERDGEKLTAICNMTGEAIKMEIPEGEVVMKNYTEQGCDGVLRPYEFMLIKN